MQKTERISCAAIVVIVDGIELAIPLQHNELPMDRVNYLMKHAPRLADTCDTTCYFITSLGHLVNAEEGMKIAIRSNQIVDDRAVKKYLSPLDIWPRL